MSSISVKFLGKDYSVPEDILTYIDLLDVTDSIQKQLASAFVCKLKDKSEKMNVSLVSDEDLTTEIEQQVGKFIAKLCDNGIYTRTINDYLKDNKGYQLYSDANKAALEKMRTLLLREVKAWKAGYEKAVDKAEAHVTGMGFSIWSDSFVNHAIYAAMEASTLNKQSKEAESQYHRDMQDLNSRLESTYGGEERDYINNTYIPNMEAAFTVFAYELLDRYVADLIANGKFDGKTLDYVDIGRSNDLLKNLTLSNNKKAVLENAFAACPYNTAVYMQAMKFNLLDYDSFQTAKVFKQDHHVLSFFRENWGEVSFPTKFNINYHCVEEWAALTGESVLALLRELTEPYAAGIVKDYASVADTMVSKFACRKIVDELWEDDILSGDSICIGTARKYVKSIVHPDIWEQLTERCGHTDLLSRIKRSFPSIEEVQSKAEFDKSVTEQLAAAFEEARKELAARIMAKRAEEERQRMEREQQQKEREREQIEQARIQAEKKAKRTAAVKNGIKRALIVVGIIAAICIALVIAGIIFLAVKDKPIDDDFAQSYDDSQQSMTYSMLDNGDSSSVESSENESLYTRYDNGEFDVQKVVFDCDRFTLTCETISFQGIEFNCKNKGNEEIDLCLDIALDGVVAPLWGNASETTIAAGASQNFLMHGSLETTEHKLMSVNGIAFIEGYIDNISFDVCDFDLGGTSNEEILPSGIVCYSTDNLTVEYIGADAQGVEFKVINRREKSLSFGADTFTINGESEDYATSVTTIPGHSQGIYSIDILTYNENYFSSQLDSFEGILRAKIDGQGIVDRFPVSYSGSEIAGQPTPKPTDKVTSTYQAKPFTNKYGTATTRCAYAGCSDYIASSGDTNCCTKHSNRCIGCNCYIDGDALMCMECITAGINVLS